MWRWVAAALVLPLVAVTGTALAATGSGAVDPVGTSVICVSGTTPTGGAATGSMVVAGVSLDVEQLTDARTIRDVGLALAIPTRGQIVAIATAMTESTLRNLNYGDRDSIGLFQQRPSAGWGTKAQIMDPVYASTKFYQALEKVNGWETMTVAQAAQAVQRSAFPDRYAAWEALGTALITMMAGTTGSCATLTSDTTLPGDVAGALPPGYTLPAGTPVAVVTAITWALRQLGTPYQWGGTCTDPHGSVASKRCDCSSLTQQAYHAANVPLTRTTYTQIHEGTPFASPADLKPGDLIFLPGHVGMYLGEGLVIHAPHTGDVVKISSFKTYWETHWVAARRIVK